MQNWQLLYNASSLQYRGLRENDVFSETEKTQLQTPQSPAGMGTAVVGRGHGQMRYFKQNLRWGCVLSHRKSVVLVRAVNHATWREIHTASPHDFCFQQLFSSSEMTCIYFGAAHLQHSSICALALLMESWRLSGCTSHASVTALASMCLFSGGRQAEGKRREKNVLLTSVKTTLGWIILLCTSTAHSL